MTEVSPQQLRLSIYARVSTEEQKEGQTIDSQISELERFALSKQWTITDVYKDEGWSGAVLARPELDRLRDDAAKGIFDAVLLNDVDRLARDVTHLGVVKRDLERKGIQVIFRKLPAESSPTHNLMVNILGSFAEFEREMISDRTRRGRLHKVEVRQQYLGSNTSYGFRYTPMDRTVGKEGILEVIPEEAAVVRQMFHWVDQEGLSARQVLFRLNERGITPRKGAATWAKSSVLRILHNEMYAGVWYYNKHRSCEPERSSHDQPRYRRHNKSSNRYRPKGEWIAVALPDTLRVIERPQWARVQEQLQKNISFSPRHEKHSYLLKSLVQCAGCGRRYVGDPGHGHFSYRCIARCKLCPAITEDILNDSVWNAIEAAILNPEVILQQVEGIRQKDKQNEDDNRLESQQVEHQLKQLQTEESRLLEAYRLGVINALQLGSELEKVAGKKRSLEDRKQQFASQDAVAPSQIRKSIVDYCREAASNIRAFTHAEKQRFLRTIVRNIVFDGTQARIQAEIPFGAQTRSNREGEYTETTDDEAHGRIATTIVSFRGRNPAIGARFDLIADIPPIQIERFVDERGRFCRRDQAEHATLRQLTQPRRRSA